MSKKGPLASFDTNAAWSSVAERQGWVHFRISGRRYGEDDAVELEMMSVVDRNVRFWLKQAELKDRALWTPGWRALNQ